MMKKHWNISKNFNIINMFIYNIWSHCGNMEKIERQKERKKKNNTTKKIGKNIKTEEDNNINSYYRFF